MKIPELTNPQYLVLSLLLEGEIPGKTLRAKLAELGKRSSAPAFYQFMARLEEAGNVKGHYQQKVVGAHAVKERIYTITASGVRAQREYLAFANSVGASRLLGGAVP